MTLPLAGQQQQPLYEKIATVVATAWSQQTPALLGLVVGATDPLALELVRAVAPETWILAPGVGAQGADIATTVAAAASHHLLIPVSRGISNAENPGAAARALGESLQTAAAQQQQKESPVQLHRYQQEFLDLCVAQGVLKFGSFVLKSGRTSPYFFNAGLFASGKALHQLGRAYASTIVQTPELM